MKIIGLTGQKGNGKSEIAKALLRGNAQHVDNGTNICTYSFAMPIKHICLILFGGEHRHWYGDAKEQELPDWKTTPRRIMQRVGTEMFRKEWGEDFWIRCAQVHLNRMDEYHRDLHNSNICVIIDDVRFDNEAEFIINNGGSIYEVRKLPFVVSEDTHASEQGISPSYIKAVVEAANMDELNLNAKYIAEENGLCFHTIQ